ncbi:MAG: thymidine phosphorylase [Clostridium sp.]|nr:thymidine phosphorylase [Clostridium sp.]MCM1444033.1 thymidine phosphorylase [Candidatus Amulumruptor caecigallinarius]
MNIIKIIEKKKNREILTKEEIDYIINAYEKGEIKDYQMSSLLMTITINGMTDEETMHLTTSMLNSGEKLDLSNINSTIVDKHSTGGVGDKTTLILAPLVASCGVKVAKMSGRGLGFTGGTIDKLESIGIKTQINLDKFIEQVNNIDVAIVGQMGNLVPADKKIYALRDVTGTTESIPLIASSIMSKKLASGADKIVIDLKVGEGALIKNMDDAKYLANLMIQIGKNNNVEVVCLITDMNEPLGFAIGNALEVMESIEVLKNKGPADVKRLVIELGTYMVSMGKNISLEEAKNLVITNLENGNAYKKFKEMVSYQGGSIENIKVAPRAFKVLSSKCGYITDINSQRLGNIVKNIGGGREKKEDAINYGVGIVLSKKIGDYVNINDELLKIYLDDIDISINELLSCFEFGEKIEKRDLIKAVIK